MHLSHQSLAAAGHHTVVGIPLTLAERLETVPLRWTVLTEYGPVQNVSSRVLRFKVYDLSHAANQFLISQMRRDGEQAVNTFGVTIIAPIGSSSELLLKHL